MTADWKPEKRIVASRTDWEQLRSKKLGPCRVCWRSHPVGLHHLVPRSQGGDDTADNLVTLCGSGTTGCHGKVENRDGDARARLRLALSFYEEKYVVGKCGRAWLDRHYPQPAEDTSTAKGSDLSAA